MVARVARVTSVVAKDGGRAKATMSGMGVAKGLHSLPTFISIASPSLSHASPTTLPAPDGRHITTRLPNRWLISGPSCRGWRPVRGQSQFKGISDSHGLAPRFRADSLPADPLFQGSRQHQHAERACPGPDAGGNRVQPRKGVPVPAQRPGNA